MPLLVLLVALVIMFPKASIILLGCFAQTAPTAEGYAEDQDEKALRPKVRHAVSARV